MKYGHIIVILSAVVTAAGVGITGCHMIPQNTASESTQESAAESKVTVRQGDKSICPYEIVVSAMTYEKSAKAWLSADGARLSHQLPQVADQLPDIQWRDDFSVDLPDDVSLYYIDLFDREYGSLERIYPDGEKDGGDQTVNSMAGFMEYVSELPSGAYYISIAVNRNGRYVESEGEYERFVNEYAFRLEK